jgi:hypothetical protein
MLANARPQKTRTEFQHLLHVFEFRLGQGGDRLHAGALSAFQALPGECGAFLAREGRD